MQQEYNLERQEVLQTAKTAKSESSEKHYPKSDFRGRPKRKVAKLEQSGSRAARTRGKTTSELFLLQFFPYFWSTLRVTVGLLFRYFEV